MNNIFKTLESNRSKSLKIERCVKILHFKFTKIQNYMCDENPQNQLNISKKELKMKIFCLLYLHFLILKIFDFL